jgi:hypothetical protein
MDALREYESSILDVAATEGIDLTVKLTVAHRELGIELSRFLEDYGVATGNVVVTEPLKAWFTFHTLVLTYRDAYHQQLADRYQAKWKAYEERAQWASRALFQLGVGVTYQPISRASRPRLSVTAGTSGAATYLVQVSWVAGGEEGAVSDPAALTVSDGETLVVTPPEALPGASGWNVYAGLTPTDMRLQNDVPGSIGANWTMPGAGLQPGRAPGSGQEPQAWLKRARRM